MSSLSSLSLWQSGRVSVSHTGDSGFKYSNHFLKIILFLSLNSLKTFRENSNVSVHQEHNRCGACLGNQRFWTYHDILYFSAEFYPLMHLHCSFKRKECKKRWRGRNSLGDPFRQRGFMLIITLKRNYKKSQIKQCFKTLKMQRKQVLTLFVHHRYY